MNHETPTEHAGVVPLCMPLTASRITGALRRVAGADKGQDESESFPDGNVVFKGRALVAEDAPVPTAVGLLARMYLGWPREDSRLARGVYYLEKLGPSRTDMYFNYYATQVLHHYEGSGWHAWNTTLRDRLVATQSRRGHEHGSWYFHDEHGQSGGRLYTTAMCVMILEVYYRHMPLYGRRAVEADL